MAPKISRVGPKYPKMAPSRERKMMWKPFFSAVTMRVILETTKFNNTTNITTVILQNFIRKYWRVLRKCTWSLKWGTNVVNTKTPETYILDYLEKYRTLTFQTLEVMFHVVISRLPPSNFKDRSSSTNNWSKTNIVTFWLTMCRTNIFDHI